MIEILTSLLPLSPIIALLVAMVLYLIKQNSTYKADIEKERDKSDSIMTSLNSELRASEKDNLIMLSKLADSLDKLANNNKVFHQEIRNLKEFIQIKLDSLNGK